MRILFVLGARSEWGYITPVYEAAKRRGHNPEIWACNTASLDGFGGIARRAKNLGYNVSGIVNTSYDGLSHVAMSKSIGAVTQAFSDYLGNHVVDWVVLSGDRAEQLGACIASTYMNIPTAHVQAGERSGNIDGLARHAIARLAHIHFASNQDASNRLVRSGEQPWRVVLTGAPQLDGLQESATSFDDLASKRLVPEGQFVLAIFHPDTARLEQEIRNLEALLGYLVKYDKPVVWIAPNNDAGSGPVRDLIQQSLRRQDYFHENVSREDFAGILASCDFMVGNSSSGIIEAPSFRKVAVNIGYRQEARFQGKNVVNLVDAKDGIDVAFLEAQRLGKVLSDEGQDHPYGDGTASEKIVDALETFTNRSDLSLKQMAY